MNPSLRTTTATHLPTEILGHSDKAVWRSAELLEELVVRNGGGGERGARLKQLLVGLGAYDALGALVVERLGHAVLVERVHAQEVNCDERECVLCQPLCII